MKYKAKAHAHFTNADANKIGHFLDHTFGGKCTPDQIVKSASPPSSPIHRYFDWDNTIAASKWRLHQARNMIDCLVTIIDEKPVKAFHSVYIKKERAYVRVDKIKASKDLWQQVVENAYQELLGWKKRYETYKAFAPVVKAIAKIKI